MKIPHVVIFLSIVLGVYTLVNVFLYYQTRPLFNLSTIGTWIKLLFWIAVIAYPLGRTLESLIGGQIPTLLVKLGSIWLAFMLYLTLLFVLFQVLSPVANYIFHIDFKGNAHIRQISTGIVYIASILIIAAGYINAISPKITELKIDTHKPLPNNKLTILMASDIHLGTIIGKKDLSKLVDRINSQKPDIVLFAGDIFDEDIAPVVNGQMGKFFEKIESRYGIYAVTGNHEFFSNYKAKINYLNDHGVKVLSDTAIVVSDINIIGRYDRQSNFALGQSRKPLAELTENLNMERFTIVMDHQPFNLDEAVEAGVDLQLSGHTHHGQMWPLNYITQSVYEVSKGYKLKGNTHFYVSPGYGTWGPRVRLGNRPELVKITING